MTAAMYLEPESITVVIVEHLQKFNTSGLTLNRDTVMASDLSIDSMAMMEMVFALEEKFDVSIPLNRLGDVRSIGELADLIESLRV